MSSKKDNLNSLSVDSIEDKLSKDLKELETILQSFENEKFKEEEIIEKKIEELDLDIEPDVKEEKKADFISDFKNKLIDFTKGNFDLGKDIAVETKDILEVVDKDSKRCIIILKKLIEISLKYKKVHELLKLITNNLDLIISSEEKEEKEKVIKDIKNKFENLKTRSKTPKKRKIAEIDEIYEKFSNLLNSKLQEINIKIEENQRLLQNISSILERKKQKPKEEILIELKEKEKPLVSEKFIIISSNSVQYAIPENFVMNTYKISPSKAEKLSKRTLIKMGQLKGLFTSLKKGLKEELKNKKNLKDLFLHVIQPENFENKYNYAVVIKIPDVDEFGVVFAQKVFLKEAELETEDSIKVENKKISILDLKSLWLKKQIDLGVM